MFRPRNLLVVIGLAIALGALFFTDVDKGVSTTLVLVALFTCLLAVTFGHITRKGLFDYLDLQEYAVKAKENPIGAGIVFFAVCQVLAELLRLFGTALFR